MLDNVKNMDKISNNEDSNGLSFSECVSKYNIKEKDITMDGIENLNENLNMNIKMTHCFIDVFTKLSKSSYEKKILKKENKDVKKENKDIKEKYEDLKKEFEKVKQQQKNSTSL